MAVELSDVALAVLAGGEGSRMGRPKAELQLAGRPILHALFDRFDWPGPTLLITAPGREHPPGCERFTRELVDPAPGEGPLRGLLTALEGSPVSRVVVTAVDMPFVRREQLAWLVAELAARPDMAGVMTARAGTCRSGAPRLEPFPSGFHVEFATTVRQQRARGDHSLHALARHPSVATVPAPQDWPVDTWTNLNRPQDLAALDASAG